MHLYIVLSLIILILIGIYVYFFIERIINLFIKRIKINKKRIIIILLTFIMIIPALNIGGSWSIVIFHFVIFAWCIDLIYWIIVKFTKGENNMVTEIYNSGIIPIILTGIFITYGCINAKNVIEKEYNIYTDKNIRNEGYKVNFISDLHFGTTMSNNELQKYLNPPHKFKVEESFQKRIFRVGDKVMQIKNNYTKKWENEDKSESGEGIYNGDIGYIYHIDKENKKIYVLFDQVKIVSYGYDELDELDHSFCTTIHKSQGSEFPVVVIPITWAPPMLLSRNLLYTAVTRAKKLVVLVGDVKYLEYMIKNNRTNDRYSNLSYKLNKFREEGLLIK